MQQQPFRRGPREAGAPLDAMKRGMAAGVTKPPAKGDALLAAMRRKPKR